ncbi:MAG TPA: peptide chain release factor N(5)-glutamine methyltransferase [Gammaproteobacteria bacterium]|jgi:release factor glutamine methyltransferase|nr:peptide chain release factor N(5)-glutamine methyltransferase [Gammaproteobacteria bacterium]
MKIGDCLRYAEDKLATVTDVPLLEAALLLAFVLDKPRSYVQAWPAQMLTAAQFEAFDILVTRRCAKEPLPYLTGRQAFWSLTFAVSPATLIPRPETELLVEQVLAVAPSDTVLSVVDLGTGSGAIGLSIAHERRKWHLSLTDQSEAALAMASANAAQLDLENVSFYCGNWCEALPPQQFDIIVSNPPYIGLREWDAYAAQLQYEPIEALVSGEEGLDAIKKIILTAGHYLKEGGHLFIEHGYAQGEAVRALFLLANYEAVCTFTDLSGHERVTCGVLIKSDLPG